MNFVPFSKYSTKKELYGSRNSKIKEDKKKKRKRETQEWNEANPFCREEKPVFQTYVCSYAE